MAQREGKDFAIKISPIDGEFIAVQQASSNSLGLRLEVYRGRAADEPQQP